ncbi:MAG TPA: terminase family protein [Rhizomicrobium sp.]|nr:terminase family protein [Rhizomicrobium sp.]
MSDDVAEQILNSWLFWARDEQLPPPGDWRTWLFLGGRGAGKTRAGAEWIADGVAHGGLKRVALLGATFSDVRAVMIEGESGLMRVLDTATYEPSNQRIKWPNGAVATVLSAEEPDGIRGHQFDAAWGDEFCKWADPQAALDMLRMALRIGRRPRMLLTTTPRNIAALKTLMAVKSTVVTKSTTAQNAPNLADGFVADLEAFYKGTRLGRQELEAEIIADAEGALWRRDWIERGRVFEAPALTRIAVAVDPPATQTGAECGIVVAGRGKDDRGYVLADRSQGGLTPHGWAERVAAAFHAFQADCVVAEVNQGGDMVKAVLFDAGTNLPVRGVRAMRGKKSRAEPISYLYEAGRVHHVGVFPELEDQLCNYDGKGQSPDRLDALVWALSELFPTEARAVPRARST